MSLVGSVGVEIFRIKIFSILAPNFLFTVQLVDVDNQVCTLRQDKVLDACVVK